MSSLGMTLIPRSLSKKMNGLGTHKVFHTLLLLSFYTD